MIIKSKLWVIQKNIEEDEKSAQKNFLNDNKSKLWVIQKNIEEDEKSAQKKEEQEKEINESSLKFNGIQNSN